jgi:hypothetical protein
MATDYILFIHGVNTRLTPTNPSYAQNLITLLNQLVGEASPKENRPATTALEMRELEWYTLMQEAESQLLDWLQDSPHWQKSWFQDFRRRQIIPFAGDSALYISRYIGSEVVALLRKQAEEILRNCDPTHDRLHLVAHSWGTVILFDILFAGRWDNPDIPGYADAQFIRKSIFGIAPEAQTGIRIASIHTLGSPIALANLINLKRLDKDEQAKLTERKVKTIFTHDITFGLQQLLTNLYTSQNRPLTWLNFAHIGDPIAYPLATVIPKLVEIQEGNKQYLDIRDISIHGNGLLEWVARLFSKSYLALINGGSAHNSYWSHKQVAQTILQCVRNIP